MKTSGLRTILIADDKPGGRDLLRTVLEDQYRVLEAVDGNDALRQAREQSPDLIILDLHMPGLDGFGVIRALRLDARFAATPVVVLTASAMQGDKEKAMEAGFTGYLTKPISLPELRRQVALFMP
jgi:CheY-like chemotaxis protein